MCVCDLLSFYIFITAQVVQQLSWQARGDYLAVTSADGIILILEKNNVYTVSVIRLCLQQQEVMSSYTSCPRPDPRYIRVCRVDFDLP